MIKSMVRYGTPLAFLAALVAITFALQTLPFASLLGSAAASLTDPIYVGLVLLTSVITVFKMDSFLFGLIAIGVIAALTSVYVAVFVHPELGFHSSTERHLLVWLGRTLGGLSILSLFWAINGIRKGISHG